MQKVLIFEKKKKPVHQLESNPRPPECSKVHYPLSHMAVVFNRMLLEFSPLLCLQPVAESNLSNALTPGDKLEDGLMMLGS